MYSRSETIMGGTSEIQRNVIAQRILGLPAQGDLPLSNANSSPLSHSESPLPHCFRKRVRVRAPKWLFGGGE